MKIKLQIAILMLCSIWSFAHVLTPNCWAAGQRNILATLGASNGKIEVTTYSNAAGTGTPIQATQTYFLTPNGDKNFYVPQPSINIQTFIYVKWFKRNNNGTYSPDNFNYQNSNGGSTSNIGTGTGQSASCTVLALKFGQITAKNAGYNTIITFQVTSNDDTNVLTFNLTYSKGVEKQYRVFILMPLLIGDTWQLTINNQTKKYTITKLL